MNQDTQDSARVNEERQDTSAQAPAIALARIAGELEKIAHLVSPMHSAYSRAEELKPADKQEISDRMPTLAKILYDISGTVSRTLGQHIAHGAGWDMLLYLFIQRGMSKKVSTKSLCLAARIPHTTALRWIKYLDQCGLIYREPDPSDSRVTLIHLTKDGVSKVESCLSNVVAFP